MGKGIEKGDEFSGGKQEGRDSEEEKKNNST